MQRKIARQELKKDLLFILLGIIIALTLSKFGVIAWLVSMFEHVGIISFIAGIFWTSAFTMVPALLVLTNAAGSESLITITIWGALGAVCGDLLLFFFIRDRLSKNLIASIKPSVVKKVLHSLRFGFFRWLSPLIAALIIVSPLPDELALTLMGISRTRVSVLIPIAFVMNIIGIYSIIWIATNI